MAQPLKVMTEPRCGSRMVDIIEKMDLPSKCSMEPSIGIKTVLSWTKESLYFLTEPKVDTTIKGYIEMMVLL
jgi:hypothetical protein